MVSTDIAKLIKMNGRLKTQTKGRHGVPSSANSLKGMGGWCFIGKEGKMPRIISGKSFYDKPWYGTYRSMMDRCYREKAKNYSRYGGRGIKVCDEWHDIVAFGEWAETNGYRKGLSIDRIDVDGDYEPSNCRWATPKQQANNRRDTPFVTIDGITRSLTEWADFAGLKRSTVSNRYYDGVRGVNLLRRPDDTRFKKGHNRYAPKKNYYIPAEAERSET